MQATSIPRQAFVSTSGGNVRWRILKMLDLLNTNPEPVLDRLARIAATAMGAPIAFVTFLGSDRLWLKGRFGWEPSYTPIMDAFCGRTLKNASLLEVRDAQLDDRFRHSRLVTGASAIRFYAGQPVTFEGIALGTVCVLDRRPRELDTQSRSILIDLSQAVSDFLQWRHEQLMRRRDAQRALDFARASGDWMWETEAQNRVVSLSSNFEDCMGISPSTSLGMTTDDCKVLDLLGRSRSPPVTLTQLLDSRAPFSGAICEMTVRSRRRLIQRSGVPVFESDGQFSGFRGTSRDVTEQVQAQVRALERDEAERVSRSKSEFLSRVSHELRTPLNAILGFTELMLLDDHGSAALPSLQRERTATVRQAGEQLLSLIDDMLDLARIEQGKVLVMTKPLAIHHLIQSCHELMQPIAKAKNVHLGVRMPMDDLLVLADERALSQVLLNLLSNAIKYNRDGGEVMVNVTAGDDVVVIMVQDTGRGLTKQQLAQLYQPFNRLGAESRSIDGLGLGLVICKALVDAMHGSLELDSRLGDGTVARVRLPRASDKRFGDALLSAAEPLEEVTRQQERRVVLYVEDNPVNVTLIEELFAQQPAWELLWAGTGQDGLRIALERHPDLVLLDVHLPDMSGIDLLTHMKQHGLMPPCGAIALSADAMADQVQAALDAGFVQYWTKPIEIRQTLLRLCGVLDCTSQQDPVR